MTKMATDHFSIGPDTFAALAEHFTPAEIVELGWSCSQSIAGHRFMHTLDMLGTDAPLFE